MSHQQITAPPARRRHCFSLDEKALCDMRYHHYSSSDTQHRSPEQSPQRTTPPEPFKPPYRPPRRDQTPEGIPSWPPLLQRRIDQREPTGTLVQRSRRKIARILGKILDDRHDHWDGMRAQIRRAIGLNLKSIRRRKAPTPRPATAWRPTMSGHSTFRFGAVETHPFNQAPSMPLPMGTMADGSLRRRRRKGSRSTESTGYLLSEDVSERDGDW